MKHESLGNIFCDAGVRVVIGRLLYNAQFHHVMVGVNLAALLPVCEKEEKPSLQACCIPWPSIKDPPYLNIDLQWCKTDKLRSKVGYIWTECNAEGTAAYQVRLYPAVVMKLWGMVSLHGHEEKEEDESTTET